VGTKSLRRWSHLRLAPAARSRWAQRQKERVHPYSHALLWRELVVLPGWVIDNRHRRWIKAPCRLLRPATNQISIRQ